MNAGYLNNKITIQKNNQTVKNGNEIDDWQDYFTCHAYVNGLSGGEYWSAKAIQSENTVIFEMRFCSELKEITTKNYRILFDGDIYDIQYIDNVQFKNTTLKIKAVNH